ncbi:MAG: class I SAM-dependent methyltransferase [Candidatus Levybacteria bacterium]|nr:class I SAM-dependent methyltransferase [Candidatus Levybacteria bacterium]
MKELRTLYTAARWYRYGPEKQYTVDQIRDYDTAADTLTDRQGFARFLASHIGSIPGKTLEVAAGTGLVSQVLKEQISELFLVDISLPALQFLRERVGDQANILQADFFNLPFVPDNLDTVVMVGGYRYVPPETKQRFWDEMRRIVKNEGRIFIAQFYPRAIPLRGNDINIDRFLIDRGFSLRSIRKYDVVIDMEMLHIKTGMYRLFEFLRTK